MKKTQIFKNPKFYHHYAQNTIFHLFLRAHTAHKVQNKVKNVTNKLDSDVNYPEFSLKYFNRKRKIYDLKQM